MSLAQAEPSAPRPPIRRRRRVWNVAGMLIAVAAIIAALAFWMSSAQFQNIVRERVASQLQAATGGRVDIASFHWHLLDLEAEAAGIVIHGDEPATEAPYAQIDRLRAQISILGFWWRPRILLRDLEVTRPQFHLIVYPDSSTNQPHPAKARKSSGSGMETLFNLKAGHVAVEQGLIDIDDRASDALDVQNRYQPLDFRGDDVSVVMHYVPASARTHTENQDSYHIDASVKDLNLSRGGTLKSMPAVHGYLQASLDLTSDAANLRWLRLTARTKGAPDRTLNVTGSLAHFARPQWNASIQGDLDMRLLDPVLGYPFAPEGIAHLNLTSGGQNSGFHIDGTVHAEHAAYVGTGVVEHGIDLSTRVHADDLELRITSVAARLQQGGEIDGEVLLHNWLPISAAPVVMEAAPVQQLKPRVPFRKRLGRAFHQQSAPPPAPNLAAPHSTLVVSPPAVIPVNGKVNAVFKNVSIDTVLDMVSQPPFKRLGIDALLNGPANATWTRGDERTLSVTSTLAMTPSGRAIPGEVPGSGTIEATYTQRDGAVEVRTLNLNLPASHFGAHGRLGAYPLTSPTALTVDFHSANLAEFDTVLRDLGLTRNEKSGAAALPVSLNGQAVFRGTWAGSLASPRLNGKVNATQIAIELPPSFNSASGEPQVLHWDTIEADGSYDAERIAIVHGELQRGSAKIVVDGTLSAAPQAPARPVAQGGELPAFDNNAVLHLHAEANNIAANDLLPLAEINAPISGALDAQIEADGPLQELGGSGSLTLKDGLIFGEPVTTLVAHGSVSNRVLNITKATATGPAGDVSLDGTYDLRARRFDMKASTGGVDLANVERLRTAMPGVTGHLGFQIAASGTSEDPRIEGHGVVDGLTVRGQSFGQVDFNGHTAEHSLLYSANTRFESANVSIQGQTELRGPYSTGAKLDFSRFDIGTIFQLAHVEGITAHSALSGTAQIAGPLARPRQMRGDLRLEQMEMTVAGVHLQSESGLHAALDNGRLSLDPMHITGDDTDLRAQGSIGFKDIQRIDFASSGSINLKLAETLDPDVTASGNSRFQIEAHGPLANPDLRGRIELQNGSFALEDLPNSLSQLTGTLEFNQNRLEIRSLTANTGGGQLSIGGYLAYQHGLYANLSLTGRSVRVRYPAGVSSQADADLQVQGTETNLLLSGKILITRFSISPDLDIASLAAQANVVQPVASPNAASNHVRLDVRIQSSPQLNFQNAYAKLAGDVDLRLRGTLASPSLQGRISITEGNATIAGTRYELQRGDITFTNPVRIQPNIDLSATARVEDYDISLGLHGTPDKLSVTYRSDPPLPEADVVALLALGRTQNAQGIYTEQQQQSAGLNPSTDVLLGGALNATVSSRVQKLFGAGSVKVDPSYLGALGNSTTRITVEEQVGKYVTLTYATNVDTTAQQLLQAEIAVNRHVSLQVTRDESGVFSMVIKAIRRYR
jgi:translocation and assembly module TamB